MAIAYFSTNGYTVSIPLNDIQDDDLIVEKENLLQRVQVNIELLFILTEIGRAHV